MLNSGSSPAACQVEPAVSSLRSSSTTSDQPRFARWYRALTPTTPPPITTTRAVSCMFRLPDRSEEHTSELQSLMRISYAVFCLNKQKSNTLQPQYEQ